MPKKGGLGKGIGAIFGDLKDLENEDRIVTLSLDLVDRSPFQPREGFDNKKLSELAESIREKGVIQPIIVREKEDRYEVVAGERRLLAAKMAGLNSVPAIIKDLTDKESAEIALIENIQRKNLNPVEEAMAYKKLIETFGYTQEELSKRIGKDRATVANSLRLLKLPQRVLEMLRNNEITAGHARALLSVKDRLQQIEIAERVRRKKLSVRETEREIYNSQNSGYLREVEEELTRLFLSEKVKIRQENNKYKIEIVIDSLDKIKKLFNGSMK